MTKSVRSVGGLRFIELFKDREGNLLFAQHTAMRLTPTGGEGTWKPVITCWVHLELMCIFPTM